MRIRRTVERAWRSDTSQRTAGDRRTLPLANEETSYVVAELPRPDAGRCPQRSTIRLQRWKTRTRDHRMPFSSYTGVTDAFNCGLPRRSARSSISGMYLSESGVARAERPRLRYKS